VQIARATTIVFNVLLTRYFLNEATSVKSLLCCAVVLFGFILGNQQEARWSLIGVAFGVTSSFFVALNSIFMKQKMSLVSNNSWKITGYNNVNACLLFIPFIFMNGEVYLFMYD
jgi:GDP-fucose transporter C1